MAATTRFRRAILSLFFQNIDLENVGDSAGLLGSTDPGTFYLSLHTAAPSGPSATQETNEVAYTGYARVSIERSSSAAGFTLTNYTSLANMSNSTAITFLVNRGDQVRVQSVGVGFSKSGAGVLMFYSTPPNSGSLLLVNNGDIPVIPAGQLDFNAF